MSQQKSRLRREGVLCFAGGAWAMTHFESEMESGKDPKKTCVRLRWAKSRSFIHCVPGCSYKRTADDATTSPASAWVDPADVTACEDGILQAMAWNRNLGEFFHASAESHYGSASKRARCANGAALSRPLARAHAGSFWICGPSGPQSLCLPGPIHMTYVWRTSTASFACTGCYARRASCSLCI